MAARITVKATAQLRVSRRDIWTRVGQLFGRKPGSYDSVFIGIALVEPPDLSEKVLIDLVSLGGCPTLRAATPTGRRVKIIECSVVDAWRNRR